jgi:hypothetical protein
MSDGLIVQVFECRATSTVYLWREAISWFTKITRS